MPDFRRFADNTGHDERAAIRANHRPERKFHPGRSLHRRNVVSLAARIIACDSKIGPQTQYRDGDRCAGIAVAATPRTQSNSDNVQGCYFGPKHDRPSIQLAPPFFQEDRLFKIRFFIPAS